ncbi:MAG: hypothetical protein Q8T03_11910 [Bacteroidota bacterium]|nr:hypothetical protein [Bacteroidota bacterium]
MTTTIYRHTFKKAFSDKEKSLLLEHIKSTILHKVKADIYLSWDDLHFKIPFLTNNLNLFAMVDKGKFQFDNNSTLLYEITYLKTSIFGFIVALTLAITSGQILMVLSMFAALLLINWLIIKNRHNAFFNDLVFYADTNFDDKTQKG